MQQADRLLPTTNYLLPTAYNPLVKVTVVGAGIVGCAVAHELASRGARVQVVDPRGVGQGATRASAGVLAPYIEGHIPSHLKLGLTSLALYDGLVERMRAETLLSIEYERCGTLQAALNDSEAAELAVLDRKLNGVLEPHSLLGADEARRLEPALSEHVVSALLIPSQGYVAAGAFLEALVRASTVRGATFSTARTLEIRGNGEAVRLITSDGSIDSDAVVLAAGSWSSQVIPSSPAERRVAENPVDESLQPTALTPAVKPIRGQLLHLGMAGRPASRVVWGERCYLVPWRDGSVLVGATVEDVGFDERATAAGVHLLLDSATELMPGLATAAFREVRVGLRPGTNDELPVVGASSTMRNVFYATGHYRSGVLLAPLTAALVADLVLDGCARPELELMRPSRFGL